MMGIFHCFDCTARHDGFCLVFETAITELEEQSGSCIWHDRFFCFEPDIGLQVRRKGKQKTRN